MGRPITENLFHEKAAHLLEFSPDGRSLISGSRDRTIRIWDVADLSSPENWPKIAKFARSVSSFELARSGRLERHFIEPVGTLSADFASSPGAKHVLMDWFFRPAAERQLNTVRATGLGSLSEATGGFAFREFTSRGAVFCRRSRSFDTPRSLRSCYAAISRTYRYCHRARSPPGASSGRSRVVQTKVR